MSAVAEQSHLQMSDPFDGWCCSVQLHPDSFSPAGSAHSDRGVLKSAIIVDLSISSCSSTSFCLVYLESSVLRHAYTKDCNVFLEN